MSRSRIVPNDHVDWQRKSSEKNIRISYLSNDGERWRRL